VEIDRTPVRTPIVSHSVAQLVSLCGIETNQLARTITFNRRTSSLQTSAPWSRGVRRARGDQITQAHIAPISRLWRRERKGLPSSMARRR